MLPQLKEKQFDFVNQMEMAEIEDEDNSKDRIYGVVFVQDKITKEELQAFLVY